MFRKILKGIGILFAGLVVVLLLVVGVAWGLTQSRLNKTYMINVDPLAIPTDPATVERGRYLANSLSTCIGCHGEDLGGEFFFNDPAIGQVYSSNLTSGQGGIGTTYTVEDWIRALRHGVGSDGKPLLIMPAQNYHRLSDADLIAVIAYVNTVPPVDRESPEPTLTFMAQVLFGLGQLGKMPAEQIDHTAPAQAAPAAGVTAEYGEYIVWVGGCRDCHGPDLTGGVAGPGEPYAPDLTQGGQLLVWTEEDFVKAFRTGETPQGGLNTEIMPIADYQMTDDDLQAVYRYLKTLPGGQTK